MRAMGSRTYKLCLSDAGLDHLLDCHCRLGRIVRGLPPYGATLFVALTIADDLPPAAFVNALDGSACEALVGREIRFVGFTGHLADLTTRLRHRVASETTPAKAPRVNRLYAAGLSCLAAADDEEIAMAYERLREVRAG